MLVGPDNSFFFYKDEKASIEIHDQYRSLIKPNCCYDNIYHLALDANILIKNPALQVAYGGKEVAGGILFLRHAFLYNKETMRVIDPTIPEANHGGPKYVIAGVFSYHGYLNALVKGKTTDFQNNEIFRAYMDDMHSWADAEGCCIIG